MGLEVLDPLCYLPQSCGTSRGWADCVCSILCPDSNHIVSLTWAETVPFIFTKCPLSATQRVILVFPKLNHNWNSYFYPKKLLEVRSSPRQKWNISTGCTYSGYFVTPPTFPFQFCNSSQVKSSDLIFLFVFKIIIIVKHATEIWK